MTNRFNIVHSPATDGDSHAGILMAVSKEFSIENKSIYLEGRVMSVRMRSLVYDNVLDVIVVYGYVRGREQWLQHLEEAVDVDVPTIIMGDFNFVTENRDRNGNNMNPYDTTFSSKMNELILLKD